MAWTSWSRTWATRTTTSRKPLRCSSKNLRWRRMYLLLWADKRLKQNHEDALLPAHLQDLFPISERSWTDIEPENYLSITYPVSEQLSTLLRHGSLPREVDGAIEFWRLKDYLRNKFEYSQHRSHEMWKSTMAKRRRKQDKISILYRSIKTRNSFTSELLKVIQDAILLILHHRTMSWFRTVSSSTFITLDVRSIYTPSWIQDWYQEDKIWAKDKQYSFCLWILWTKNTKILRRSTSKHRVLHNTCRQRGRNIKTLCIWSISDLLKRKD